MDAPERLRPLLEAVLPLAERFARAGHALYLVGGSVRDALLGRDLADLDLDLTTDARPEAIEALLGPWADATWTQGRRFGTIGARRRGRTFEVTTHRAEAYVPESRKPEVRFSDDVEVDLSRRDFTVNAMALSLPALDLVDPHDGVADLAAGVLRTPLDATESFSDDPLRMLRAARFVAGYGFAPVPELTEAVVKLRDRLAIVSAERIRDELDRLLVVADPTPGLRFLLDTGVAEEVLPEVAALAGARDPLHRHKDVLAHTLAVVARTSPRRVLRMAALLHDVGKPRTRAFGPDGVTFHHHEVVGARMAERRLRELRYPAEDLERVRRLVELHLRFHGYGEAWTDAAVRRYARDAGDLLADLNELTRCDCTTRNRARADALARRMDDLEARIEHLRAREALDAIRPDLDGHEVMDHLGLAPGPEVGAALAHLLELRLDEGPLGQAEAYRRLDAWWAARRADAGS